MSNLLSLTLAALADPTRRAMLLRLAEGEATVGELGAPFALSQPAISKHIKVLERAGLISRGRLAQTRPCRLEPDRLAELDDFMGYFRTVAEPEMDQLAACLSELQSKGTAS